jgi:hypothetical protein
VETFERSFGVTIQAVVTAIKEALDRKDFLFLAACVATAYQIGKNMEKIYNQLPWVPDSFKIDGSRKRVGGVGAGEDISHKANGGAFRAAGMAILAVSSHKKAKDAVSAKGNPLIGQVMGSDRARPILQEMMNEHSAAFRIVSSDPKLIEAADATMEAMYPSAAAPSVPSRPKA